MKYGVIMSMLMIMVPHEALCWGFYAHRLINRFAVYLLPPQMMMLYKKHILYLEKHAVDPDKRRYINPNEGPRHYIDMDRYGPYPFSLPQGWNDAAALYSEDTLRAHGIVPWWCNTMLLRLTDAFRQRDPASILRLSAHIGHYLADMHVPLHASSNHNGQKTGQDGIHGFWESRIPEVLAEKEWDFFIGKARYIHQPLKFCWLRVYESAKAADTVLTTEKHLSRRFSTDSRFAFEKRGDIITRQYSTAYTIAFDRAMGDMVQRRMRQSIFAVASFWYTAWVNAGQPDLSGQKALPDEREDPLDSLNILWKNESLDARECE